MLSLEKVGLGDSAGARGGCHHSVRNTRRLFTMFFRIFRVLASPGGLPAVFLERDKPSRFALPMTALRLTPISWAICAHESPASVRCFRRAMRSTVHVL